MHVVHVCMYVYACMHDMYVCYVMYLHVWYCWLCIRIRARHVLMGQWDGATWRGNWTYNTGTKDFDRITSSSSSSYVKFSFVFSCHLFFFFFFQEKLPPFRVYLRVRVRVRVRASSFCLFGLAVELWLWNTACLLLNACAGFAVSLRYISLNSHVNPAPIVLWEVEVLTLLRISFDRDSEA